MPLAPFFSRAYSAVGSHLGITRKELEKTLTGHTVGIHLAETCNSESNDQWIAELLANLLSRLYPTISISGDKTACKNISELALSINPNIEIIDDRNGTSITVYIGEQCTNNKGFSACASGWLAYVGKDYKSGPANPYSSGVSASLAAWRVFQTIFKKEKTKKENFNDISLSLLDFGTCSGASDELPAVNVGEVAVVGLGAVGNSAVWAWARHTRLTGKLHLIDNEDVELSNLQRYSLPKYEDYNIGKVQLAERELGKTKLKLKLWPCTVEDFAQRFKGIRKLQTICVSVDNIEGRRTTQALLPRLVVNGWTSDNGLGTSWHRFLGNEACLACLYHPKGQSLSQTELAAKALGIKHEQLALLWVSEKPIEKDEIRTIEKHLKLSKGKLKNWKGKRVQDVYSGVVCGQIGIDLKAIGRVATVPLAHQSMLAGFLMAAELVKRSDQNLESKSQTEILAIWDDVMRPPPKYWKVNRQKNPECFCCDEIYKSVYENKWKG